MRAVFRVYILHVLHFIQDKAIPISIQEMGLGMGMGGNL